MGSTPQTTAPTRSTSVVRSASATGLGTAFSRVFGLVREQVFAYYFGAGAAMDAFNIAFRIPNLLRDLFAEGALSSALVPTFLKTRQSTGEAHGWRVAGLVFWTLLGFLGLISVLGIVFSPELVSLYADAFRAIPGKFELTVVLTQILWPFLPLVAVAAAVMGVLNAMGVFFIPAFASAIFNIVSVVAGLILVPLVHLWGYPPIVGMALGVVLGGLGQLLIQLPWLKRAGFPGMFSVFKRQSAPGTRWFREPALREMLVLMAPATVGVAATQINILVNSILATGLMSGSVSWLNYAFRLMQFPIGIFGVSLAGATLPEFTRRWIAATDGASAVPSAPASKETAVRTLERSLGWVMAVNLPATAGLIVLSVPIIQCIYQYGVFDLSDTQYAAQALMAYAGGLAFYSGVKVLAPVFYTLGEVRTVVMTSLCTVALSSALSFLLSHPFGFWGLALATAIGAVFNFLALFFVLGRRLRALGGRSWDFSTLLVSFGKSVLASAVMAAVLFALMTLLHEHFPDSWFVDRGHFFSLKVGLSLALGRVLKVIFLVSIGVIVFSLMGRTLRSPEITEAVTMLRARLPFGFNKSRHG